MFVDVQSGLDEGLFGTPRLMIELHTVIAIGIFVVVFLEILQKRSLIPHRGGEALGCFFGSLIRTAQYHTIHQGQPVLIPFKTGL